MAEVLPRSLLSSISMMAPPRAGGDDAGRTSSPVHLRARQQAWRTACWPRGAAATPLPGDLASGCPAVLRERDECVPVTILNRGDPNDDSGRSQAVSVADALRIQWAAAPSPSLLPLTAREFGSVGGP